MTWAALMLASYLLGAVPFGVIIASAKGVDLTKVGSGNTGATNSMRALGKPLGFAVLALDILKGLIPSLAGLAVFGTKEAAGLAGVCAILGHCVSPFLRFKGGKGISTGLGALFGTSPYVAFSALGVFALFFGVWRYVSLASLIGCVSLVGFGILFGDPQPILIGYVVFAAFALYRHRGNLSRLLKGTEPKFEWKKNDPS